MSVHRTPATSGAIRKLATTTPSPTTTSAAAQDAAKTFIKRPNVKRRSLTNMEIYSKRRTAYVDVPNDELLRELMMSFEEIPVRVQEYPSMRRDIKQFLEEKSDRGLVCLFELSRRVKEMEVKNSKERTPVKAQPSSEGHDDILKRLGEMEATLTERIDEMEKTLQSDMQGLDVCAGERSSSMQEEILERLNYVGRSVCDNMKSLDTINEDRNTGLLGGIGDRLEETKAAMDQKTEQVGGQTRVPPRGSCRGYRRTGRCSKGRDSGSRKRTDMYRPSPSPGPEIIRQCHSSQTPSPPRTPLNSGNPGRRPGDR
ncbi:unnamed protein product [Arctia plantaginis]|uniref:Uncharacterized protein n=1 Tax=Arctia plantaginis TaxID=874455 RepID=A0A8S1BDQ4_ARCPL|nr:unnamed protein product [Arctia plantaginis]